MPVQREGCRCGRRWRAGSPGPARWPALPRPAGCGLAQHRPQPFVGHAHGLLPQVAHLAHLPQGGHERRGQRDQPPGKCLHARCLAALRHHCTANGGRHLRAISIPMPGQESGPTRAARRAAPAAAPWRAPRRRYDHWCPTPGAPGCFTVVTGRPGRTRPCANQLLPACGPKKSPARTMITRHVSSSGCGSVACCRRRSSSTRTAPLRVRGCWGASSCSTGKASGP